MKRWCLQSRSWGGWLKYIGAPLSWPPSSLLTPPTRGKAKNEAPSHYECTPHTSCVQQRWKNEARTQHIACTWYPGRKGWLFASLGLPWSRTRCAPTSTQRASSEFISAHHSYKENMGEKRKTESSKYYLNHALIQECNDTSGQDRSLPQINAPGQYAGTNKINMHKRSQVQT